MENKNKMKNLKKIIGAGALALALAGCVQTEYEGKIGEEQVKFSYEHISDRTILTVKKQDGKIIKYVDIYDNNSLDYITIAKDGQTTRYENDKIGKQVLERAQNQFNYYLMKIEIAQTEETKNKIIKGINDLEWTTKKIYSQSLQEFF